MDLIVTDREFQRFCRIFITESVARIQNVGIDRRPNGYNDTVGGMQAEGAGMAALRSCGGRLLAVPPFAGAEAGSGYSLHAFGLLAERKDALREASE